MTTSTTHAEATTLPSSYRSGRVGVVTVLFNSTPVLSDFFESLENQTYENLQIYCVDNNSQDGCAQLCADRSGPYRVIRNSENWGFATGTNIGVEAALADGCEYILLLNNDVVFGPELVHQLVEGIHRHSAHMTAPLIYFHEVPTKVWYGGGGFRKLLGNQAVHHGVFSMDVGQFTEDRRTDYATMCCVLLTREAFRRVGMLDDRYFNYCEDADWMLRAKHAGLSLWFLHEAKLWHKVSSLTGFESDFGVQFIRRNRAYFLYKHCHWLVASALSGAYCSFYALNLLVPSRRKRAWLCLRSWWEGIGVYRSAVTSAQLQKPDCSL